MDRARVLTAAAVLALMGAACSANVEQPEARRLTEANGRVFARFVSGTDASDRTATGFLTTADGKGWAPASGEDGDLGRVAVALQQPGQTEECDVTGTCFRVSSPAGGIRVDQSTDSGSSWAQTWSISAGRIDFQDRCCGSRPFLLDDLEYVPATGVVAVSLGRYGLLTRDIAGMWRLDTLGRPDRPESGFMVGLYIEPLVLALIGMVIGWVTSEIQLSRLRRELMEAHPADHEWITGRARLAPILPPVLFLGAVAIVAALAVRTSAVVESDPSPSSGWWGLAAGAALVTGTALAGHRLLIRQWRDTEAAKNPRVFEDSRRIVISADLAGVAAMIAATLVPLVPLVAWTTGTIDEFGDAVVTAAAFVLILAAAFWARAALVPIGDQPSPGGESSVREVIVEYDDRP